MPSAPRDRFSSWIAGYERAWRAAGTAALDEVFAPDATYQPAPFEPPLRGIQAIAEFWEDNREGPDENFTLSSELVATDRRTGVARVEVRYGDPVTRIYRDLWIITLDGDGRCNAFEEWPFFPGQPRTSPL